MPHTKTISLDAADRNYDVYVLLYKEGKVSAPVKINTGAGGVDVGPEWWDVPYKSYYVSSSNGDDAYAGTKAAPLATVEKALANLNAAYESWPGKGTEPERPGAIVILDTVEVSKMLEIKGEDYPPIILSDDSVMSGGKLQAKEQIQIENGGTSLLKLTNNASVTLEGGLILAGLGKDATS